MTKRHRSNWIRPQVFVPRWVQWWSTRFLDRRRIHTSLGPAPLIRRPRGAPPCTEAAAGRVILRIFFWLQLLTTYWGHARTLAASLIEGVFSRRSWMRSEAWRPAAAACNRSPREAREAARQALRPGCEELAVTDPAQMPVREARPRVKNRHGGAPRGERPAS